MLFNQLFYEPDALPSLNSVKVLSLLTLCQNQFYLAVFTFGHSNGKQIRLSGGHQNTLAFMESHGNSFQGYTWCPRHDEVHDNMRGSRHGLCRW